MAGLGGIRDWYVRKIDARFDAQDKKIEEF